MNRQVNLHLLLLTVGPTGVEFAAELYDFLNEDLVGYVKAFSFRLVLYLRRSIHMHGSRKQT